jgi:hypothetical protein
MEAIFRKLKLKWKSLNAQRKGHYYGIVIDDPSDPMTNLRFADDVLLFGGSKSDIGKMIVDLKIEAKKYGLALHIGKTKVLTNTTRRRPSEIDCGGQAVEVVGDEAAERYLGRQLAMTGYHATELANRVGAGWKSFFKFKAVLCNRGVPAKSRLGLSESVVTPCVLYASGTWTMTVDAEAKLRTTRRKMLRWMMRIGRKPEEDWVEYIKRATARCDQLAADHGVSDWVGLQRERKWKLAGQTANRDDQRWNTRLLTWKPWFRNLPYRSVGHPCKRWDDDIVKLAGGSWMDVAKDANLWQALKCGYLERLS